MSIKLLIVEDEVLVAEHLKAELQDLNYEVTDICISSEECFESVAKVEPDVILMDINIKGELNGIQLSERLNGLINSPIIYLTSNTDPLTLSKAVATKPTSFISKPYNLKDLKAAIEIAFDQFNEIELPIEAPEEIMKSVFVKRGDLFHRIQLDEILYVEASGSYCVVTTEKGEYILSMNLQNFNQKTGQSFLVRSHRSFLVNINRINSFDSFSLFVNEKELPISKSYKEALFKHLNKI